MTVSWADLDTAARTVKGEVDSEGYEGQKAVSCVIKNRWKIGGWYAEPDPGAIPPDNLIPVGTIRAVCLRPWQFSCWNANDPNRKRILAATYDDGMFRQCLRAFLEVLDGNDDITQGATHYLNPAILSGLPSWAREESFTVSVGRHRFFRLIN